ncbi:hypothetical protein FHG87_019439 [Trinorchestia longiramus]|nr:hypothetical protein FHG87_019439 [Trinorchestia longiramus]
MDSQKKYDIKAAHKAENMRAPKKYDRKAAIKASYKSSYGNRQKGVGRAIIAKDVLQRKYERLKYKEELRKIKEQHYATGNIQDDLLFTEKHEVAEAELRFLPAVVREPEAGQQESDAPLDHSFVKRRY